MPDPKQHPDESDAALNAFSAGLSVMENLYSATQGYLAGMSRYTTDFFIPYLLSTNYFQRVEGERLLNRSPMESFAAYLGLLDNNIELMDRSLAGTSQMMIAFAKLALNDFNEAVEESRFAFNPQKMARFTRRQAELLNEVTHIYPQAIKDIEPEFGFHFESGRHLLLDETDRFLLYRVAPSLKGVEIRMDAKPLLILPPFVLGANILGFLPGEQRSYAHCYANQGFPTYIRVLKDIDASPALQTMTGEDDARDTGRFCAAIMKAHGKPVTLNGYCQGGFSALCDLLSGELDDLVDAFITCVAPMDGTRSKGLAHFLKRLPRRFNDLAYGTKRLPSGNEVADGKLMGWIYKLKSIEQEIPAAAFFRDLMMFARQTGGDYKISKTAAALNYWLQNERFDLPLEITRMSFASYNVPITADGALPVRLFGKELNLKRLQARKIPWLICYGTHDDLVEKETALAPLDYIEAEVTPFPKGHVAIATSWSHPESTCALHTRFGNGNQRGPVRFHMDLDEALTEARNLAAKAKSAKAKGTRKSASPKSTRKPPASPKKSPSGQAKGIKKAPAKTRKPKRAAKGPAAKRTTATKAAATSAQTKAAARSAKKK